MEDGEGKKTFLIFKFQNHEYGSTHGSDDNCHQPKIPEPKPDVVTGWDFGLLTWRN